MSRRQGTSDLRAGRENNNEKSTNKSRTGYRHGDARGMDERGTDESEFETGEKKAEVGCFVGGGATT